MKTNKGVELPQDFAEVMGQHPEVWAAFEAMPPSHQREYVGWIEEAKKPETRQRRIANALTMIQKWDAERKCGKRKR